MLFGHGWRKLVSYSENSATFADPLGVGPALSLALVVLAEFFCSALLAFGLFTRLAAIPLAITMSVAAFVIHGNDPWGKKEMAIVYLLIYLTLLFAGPGRISLDRKFGR
jgi:putative oxidoreductase